MNSNLIEYGHSFQQKFVASLLSDKDYLHQIIDILDENQFDSEANCAIVKIIKEYFLKYNDIPTLDVFKIEINKLNNELLKTSIVENLRDIFRKIQGEIPDAAAIKEEALSFFKNQNLKTALGLSVDLLELNKFDEIRNALELAFRAGESKKSGHDYRKDVEQRYIEDKRNPLSTSFELIDEITDGGLGAGDLGIIIGSKGSGKCVGGNTEIEIQYDEIGIQINKNGKDIIIWFDPWEKFNINDEILFGWQIELLFKELEKLNKK
jgi:hypothetical protein